MKVLLMGDRYNRKENKTVDNSCIIFSELETRDSGTSRNAIINLTGDFATSLGDHTVKNAINTGTYKEVEIDVFDLHAALLDLWEKQND